MNSKGTDLKTMEEKLTMMYKKMMPLRGEQIQGYCVKFQL